MYIWDKHAYGVDKYDIMRIYEHILGKYNDSIFGGKIGGERIIKVYDYYTNSKGAYVLSSTVEFIMKYKSKYYGI